VLISGRGIVEAGGESSRSGFDKSVSQSHVVRRQKKSLFQTHHRKERKRLEMLQSLLEQLLPNQREQCHRLHSQRLHRLLDVDRDLRLDLKLEREEKGRGVSY